MCEFLERFLDQLWFVDCDELRQKLPKIREIKDKQRDAHNKN